MPRCRSIKERSSWIPHFALALARLALSYARLYIIGYDRSEARLKQIRTAAEAALRLQPDVAEAQLALGHYRDDGKREERRALQSYERALRGLPNSPELHAALARLYRGQARWEDAIAAHKRALTLNPNLLNVALDLALTYSLLRRYDLAIPLMDSLIALRPDDHSAKLSKGYMVMRRDGTLDTLAAALERIPADWNPQGMGVWARTIIARAQRRPERALAVLNAATLEWIGKGPILLSKTLVRAHVHEELGDTVSARADHDSIRRVLEDSATAYPTDARWRILLGLSYAGLQRQADATREARRALELMPSSRNVVEGGRVMVGAAEIFARAGDADNALQLLDRPLSIPAGPAATVPLLRLETNWDPLRDDPRFDRLLERHDHLARQRTFPVRM